MTLITICDVTDKSNQKSVTINIDEISDLVEVEVEEWRNVCGWADFFGPPKVKCTNIYMNNGNLYQVGDTMSEFLEKLKTAKNNTIKTLKRKR